MAEPETPDSGDFHGFYTATVTRIVGYLYVVLGNLAEAEDAAHEAYVRAWQRWSKVSTYDDPEGWVRSVAFRVAVSSWRKARNRVLAHRATGTLSQVPDMSPDRLAVVEALRRIPVEQRRALVLFHMQCLTVAEIAQETGVPEGTVKARLSRGRKALAPHVSEFADDVGPGGTAPPSSGSAAGSTKKGVVSGA